MLKRLFTAQILSFLIIFTIPVVAQTYTSLKQTEDALKSISRLITAASSDSERLILNSRFQSILGNAVRLPGSFDYPFDSLKTLGKLTSPDKRFRMYNWNLPKSDGSNISFCILQVYNKGKDRFDYFDLTDNSDSISQPEVQVLDIHHWYGSLYYKIIENTSTKDMRKYYTLLGWITRSNLVAEKIIDVLTFDDVGIPHFGAKIFKHFQDGQVTRVLFKYSSSARMALKYNEMDLPDGKKSSALLKEYRIKGKKAKMIIFDHLVPLDPQLKDQYQFYVPEADTYDAFVFSKDGWVYLTEVDARNTSTPSSGRK